MAIQYTNDDDEDDWDISSLDDLSVPAPVRKSLDSDSATSVWGTSTGKGQKTGQSLSLSQTWLHAGPFILHLQPLMMFIRSPGLNEAGTGSTLKSSLVSVSDWSDDDI